MNRDDVPSGPFYPLIIILQPPGAGRKSSHLRPLVLIYVHVHSMSSLPHGEVTYCRVL